MPVAKRSDEDSADESHYPLIQRFLLLSSDPGRNARIRELLRPRGLVPRPDKRAASQTLDEGKERPTKKPRRRQTVFAGASVSLEPTQVLAGQADKETPTAVWSMVRSDLPPPTPPRRARKRSLSSLKKSLQHADTPERSFERGPKRALLARDEEKDTEDTDTDDGLFPLISELHRKKQPAPQPEPPITLDTSSEEEEEADSTDDEEDGVLNSIDPEPEEEEDADQEQDTADPPKLAIQKAIAEVKRLKQRAESYDLELVDAALMILGVVTNLIVYVATRGAGQYTMNFLRTAAENALQALLANANTLVLGADSHMFRAYWDFCIQSLEMAENHCF